eukprot:scaffold31738_cov26-Tisochrysis_lutea.AAC.4
MARTSSYAPRKGRRTADDSYRQFLDVWCASDEVIDDVPLHFSLRMREQRVPCEWLALPSRSTFAPPRGAARRVGSTGS